MTAVGKTQAIRALDVVAIGPAMIWGGSLLAQRRPLLGWFLVAAGAATVVYNWANWTKQRDQESGDL